MFKVLDVKDTLKLLKEKISIDLKTEEIELLQSINRVLARDILCKEDIPSFNRSTMDGYAVKAEDTFGASMSIPAILTKVKEIKMGEEADFKIKTGQAAYIPTGGMLPEGADSVVMIEYTEMMDKETLTIENSVSPGENIVHKGEDIKKGEEIFKKGRILKPHDIGVLASLGFDKVKVYKKPVISVISTGNELIDVNEDISIGKIRDINTYSIGASIFNDGFECITYGIIKDSFDDLKSSLESALEKSDVVILSGGSSVGILDLTYKVIDSIDNSEVFMHGVSVKPGKPTIAARVKDKGIFGLPGNPVSAFMIYKVIVSKFLKSFMITDNNELYIEALFDSNYSSAPGRDEYLPVKIKDIENNRYAVPIYGKSSMMNTLSMSDGFVRINSSKEGLYENEKVKVYLF